MSYVKFNYVYRDGAPDGSPVPSFFMCTGGSYEVDDAIDGDTAYEASTGLFMLYGNSQWNRVEGKDYETRINLLEFLVMCIIKKGFGGF